MFRNQIYIAGQWIQTEEQMDVYNPADGKVIGTVSKAGKKEAGLAVDARRPMRLAYGPAERRMSGENSLRRWHQLIAEHTDDLARIMTTEQGNRLRKRRARYNMPTALCPGMRRRANESTARLYPDHPAGADHCNEATRRRRSGDYAVELPASMITRKVAPALAAGRTVVIKPSSETPFTAIKLVELADQAGIPAGVINIVTGASSDISGVWQADSRVRKLSLQDQLKWGNS